MAIREASPLGHQSTLPAGGRVPWVCQESDPPEPPKPRLLDPSATPSRPATTVGALRKPTCHARRR